MDACPSCGARLTGDPSWCPRCLSRFDRADREATARQFAALWGDVTGSSTQTAGPPPKLYTPPTPPALPSPATPPAAPVPLLPKPADAPLQQLDPSPAVAGPGTQAARKNPIPRTVVTAILMGVGLQAVSYALTRGLHLQAPTAVAVGLGLTIAFYLLVLSLVQGRLFDSDVRPVWHLGSPGTGLAIGVAVGGSAALLVVTAASAIAGHLTSDDMASTVFAQGGLLRIAALVTIMVVCAPFIEELLFRGLLAESLRPRGRAAAIWLSALAFALWHLRPDALRYYLLCGALLGLLYWKRGLVCSMSAHATFNGTLVLVAALSVSGPAHTVSGAGVTLTAPSSWREVTAAPADTTTAANSTSSGTPTDSTDVQLQSPSGAQVFLHRLQVPGPLSSAVLTSRLNASPTIAPGVTIKGGMVRPVQYPAGEGAAADVDDNGHDAEAVVITSPQGGVVAELFTAGNANANPQFESMLESLRFG
ncbi:MAG: CPBP family intramembrane metalloprotease [Acidimicrobiia bacterium]|nr:CPBP family intramembrane metalloprotease [Acidimicrobiia bacterium]